MLVPTNCGVLGVCVCVLVGAIFMCGSHEKWPTFHEVGCFVVVGVS